MSARYGKKDNETRMAVLLYSKLIIPFQIYVISFLRVHFLGGFFGSVSNPKPKTNVVLSSEALKS